VIEFIGITGFILLVAISPGADFALVVKNSLLYSRVSAFYTALGIGVSLIVHTTYSLMGLALVISKSLLFFTIIKYLGAAYLCYLGIKSIMEKEDKVNDDILMAKRTRRNWKSFQQGFLCNMLNPKAPLFFISFYSVIIPTESNQLVKLLYGIESVVLITLWFILLSIIISNKSVKAFFRKSKIYLTKILGGVMIFFGIKLALTASK
jgi:RhtB (resistance to homoserine/threonine) family protein